MAMNKQRRTANLNNIVTYDTLKNVTLLADLTVEGLTGAGFVKADVNGLLSVDTGAYLPFPSQTGNTGKYLTTDGSNLSWGTVTTLYAGDGTLAGNRVVTLDDKQLVFRTNSSALQNYTFTVGSPTGVAAPAWPASVVFEGEYLMNSASAEPYNTRVWGRNQSSAFRALWVNQIIADITAESTGTTAIYNQWYSTRRGSSLDTSTNSNNSMLGVVSQVGHYYNSSNSTTAAIVTATQEAIRGEIINYTGTITSSISIRASAAVGYSTVPRNTTVVNHYGVKIDLSVGYNASFTSLLSNYYGVYISTPTVGGGGSITNRWGVYAPDSAMSHHLNGNLLLGTATDTGLYKLDVQGTASVKNKLYIQGNLGFLNYIVLSANNNDGYFLGDTNTSLVVQDRWITKNNTNRFSFGNFGSVGTNGYTFTCDSNLNGNFDGIVINNGNTNGSNSTSLQFYQSFPLSSYITSRISSTAGTTTFFDPQNPSLSLWVSDSSRVLQEVIKLTSIGNVLIGTPTDLPSAILNITSTTKGFLQPRMTTTQRDAIATPATGLQVYNTTTNTNDYYNGSSWNALAVGNIYTTDGTLTGNRTVTMSSFTLSFTKDILVNGLTVGKGGGNVSTNTALGAESLAVNTTGFDNSAFGFQSARFLTTGLFNSAFGLQALRSSTAGTNNSAFGTASLYSSQGNRNSSFGAASFYSLSSGNDNTSLGFNSGRYLADGVTGNTTSNTSIFIGSDTKANSNNQTNQIVIGYNETGLGSNTTIIGNSSTVTTAIRGRMLLGTTTDSGLYMLDVSGTGRFTNTLSIITTGTTNDVALFKSTEPYITIEAAGASNSASIFLKPSTSAQNATIQNRTGGGLEFYTGATPSLSATITAANNLVVGSVTAATQKLQVSSTSGDNHLLVWGATAPSIRIDNAATGATQRFVFGLTTATSNFITGSVAGDICMTTQSSNPLLFGANSTEVMRITTSSNLLIGTSTDTGLFKLDVNGTARVSGALVINGTTGQVINSITQNSTNGLIFWGSGSTTNFAFADAAGDTRLRLLSTGIWQYDYPIRFGASGLILGSTTLGNRFITYSSTDGVFLCGTGSASDVTISNNAQTHIIAIKSTGSCFIGAAAISHSPSAQLDVVSTTKGFLPPRMTTTEKNAISSPAAGLVVYDTTLNKLCVRTASAWETITSV